MSGTILFAGSILLVCSALSVWLKMYGPTRALKISLVVFVLAITTVAGLYVGWDRAFGFVGLLVVVNLAAMSVGAVLHKFPTHRVLSPADGDAACPPHGREQLGRWTRELQELGFDIHSDHEAPWTFGSSQRRLFIRFLRSPSRESWAELHVVDEPKVAARMLVSRTGPGHWVATCDKQANEEFFVDALTHVNRVPSGSSCSVMVRAHTDFSLKAAGPPMRIDDPIAAHIESYDGWIERLIASRQLKAPPPAKPASKPASNDDSPENPYVAPGVDAQRASATIPLHRALGMTLRVMAAWFH